jgi:hypothetical protein
MLTEFLSSSSSPKIPMRTLSAPGFIARTLILGFLALAAPVGASDKPDSAPTDSAESANPSDFDADNQAKKQAEEAKYDPDHYVKLPGGVKMLALTMHELRDAKKSVDKVKRVSSDIYDEMTRVPIQMGEMINAVGSTVINIPVPVGIGDALPARPKWVSYYMNELVPLIHLMKEEIDEVESGTAKWVMRDDLKEALKPHYEEWKTVVKDVVSRVSILQTLTQKPPYDQAAAAKEAKDINKDAKKLEKTRNKIEKVFKKKSKEKTDLT